LAEVLIKRGGSGANWRRKFPVRGSRWSKFAGWEMLISRALQFPVVDDLGRKWHWMWMANPFAALNSHTSNSNLYKHVCLR